MKIDTHVHSMGISKCSRVDYREIATNKLKAGYQGAVIMNHCQPWYYTEENYSEWKKQFIEEFNTAYEYGKSVGFVFIFGIEISISNPRWADFLFFGVTNDFILNAPDFCKLSQKEIYEYSQSHGVLMVQAHPFRPNFEPLDPAFMHGVEINCSTIDVQTRPMVEEFAKKHCLAITVGTDYHEPYEGDVGGIIVPDNVENSTQLCEFLKQSETLKVFVGEQIFTVNGFKK